MITQLLQIFHTLPGVILEDKENYCAIYFACKSSNWDKLWRYNLSECSSLLESSNNQIELHNPVIFTVQEGLELLGNSKPFVAGVTDKSGSLINH
jgi:hypothetical protein